PQAMVLRFVHASQGAASAACAAAHSRPRHNGRNSAPHGPQSMTTTSAVPAAPSHHAEAESFAIIGYGRFGAAFCELLAKAGHRVRAFDPRAAIAAEFATSTLADAVAGARWVVLAMPVPMMRAALVEVAPLLRAEQVVLDVGSVKLAPC